MHICTNRLPNQNSITHTLYIKIIISIIISHHHHYHVHLSNISFIVMIIYHANYCIEWHSSFEQLPNSPILSHFIWIICVHAIIWIHSIFSLVFMCFPLMISCNQSIGKLTELVNFIFIRHFYFIHFHQTFSFQFKPISFEIMEFLIISFCSFFYLYFLFLFFLFQRGAKKDPYYERKKPVKKYHSMKSPKYLPNKNQPQQKYITSQIGKS